VPSYDKFDYLAQKYTVFLTRTRPSSYRKNLDHLDFLSRGLPGTSV